MSRKLFTHLANTVSGKRTVLCVSRVTNRRCDICNVGPSSMANVCCCCFSCCCKNRCVVSSFSLSTERATAALMTASKCSSSHMSSVRLQPGNWLISASNSCCWAVVCVANGPVAISSKRGNRSVVNSGSGNSLQIGKVKFSIGKFCGKLLQRHAAHRINTFNRLHAVGMSNSSSATASRLLYVFFSCCSFVFTTSTL